MAGVLVQSREAAATLTAGTDAFRNEGLSQSSRPRVIRGIAIAGGNAVAEASVRLRAGRVDLGTYFASRSGVATPLYPDDYQAIAPIQVAPGDRLSAIIVTAPTVNPLSIQVHGDEY